MTIAIVAEKPAVARDIAAVIGATRRGEGCLMGNGHVVTWAIGHLVALAQPHEIDPAWKRWSLATLPMLPERFPLVVVPETRAQFEIVRRILQDRSVERVVCATDAGREGELIFRYIYEAAGCRKPVSRLWISSLTEDAIREGLRRMKSSSEYDRLADAARGRSRADWLVGMNLSRAYALTLDQEISVGRVQTPTLAMLVDREIAIRGFVPEDYLEVVATFGPASPGAPGPYEGTWLRPEAPAEKREANAHKPNSSTNGGRDARAPDGGDARRRLPADGREASEIVARARSGEAAIESIDARTRRLPPPLLYDLTELQRHCNRLFGFRAQHTLDVAQALYERHKVLSYPRTDSRHLSTEVAATLGDVARAIGGRYPGLLAPGTGTRPLGRRFVDDAQVSDHHAILPTATPARQGALGPDEQKVYDLVCRRLLMAWHEDHVFSVTTVITAITTPGGPPILDRYESRGTAVERPGWKVLDLGGGKKPPSRARKADEADSSSPPDDPPDQALPAGLARGERRTVEDAQPVSKRTRPPPRYTEATLLTAMETAGRALEEKELSDAMKDSGLGTPATRAQIIETLLKREYIVRQGKSLEATEKGIGLVSVVHPEVKSPAMTGEWEAKLRRLQRGEGDLATFMAGIAAYVTGVVARVAGSPPDLPPSGGSKPRRIPSPAPETTSLRSETTSLRSETTSLRSETTSLRSETTSLRSEHGTTAAPATPSRAAHSTTTALPAPARAARTDLHELLRSAFGFPSFRPHQEEVCRAAALGRDVLLVMPTGAGKSLCYQLPGLARGGTTLVISPLIALMEDQSAALSARGLRSDRIHSGRGRADSRAACVAYLAGRLDFLFIAPERLRVPGFPEMLAKRTPALIAVDEAHCISQWGHDFRPDYRMLGQRLPGLRPAPIIALTATATPDVQDDIVTQLGMERAERFIHGFRRTNIAVEVLEMNPGERPGAVRAILSDRARRPAIVYAATRKSAEDLAATLGERLAAAYHAGMEPADRDEVQSAFLSGRLEVVVATTAFGMGIDKADVRTIVHAALPGSLEGYYQEIGRAGRDGQPSSAVLMHAWVDRKIHESFHERDYPDPADLSAVHKLLTKRPAARDKLRKKAGLDPETFDRVLEKLVQHGGAEVSPEGEVTRGGGDWLEPYCAQREHKRRQLDLMARFAAAGGCRMVHMVRHFGDQEDSGEPCGLCDACAPAGRVASTERAPTPAERAQIARILGALAQGDGQATGRLHRETFPDDSLDRRSFERLLRDLARAGLVTVEEASFEKDGERITYQRASLTSEGRRRGPDATGITLSGAPAGTTKRGERSGRDRAPGKKWRPPGTKRRAGTKGKPAGAKGKPARPFNPSRSRRRGAGNGGSRA